MCGFSLHLKFVNVLENTQVELVPADMGSNTLVFESIEILFLKYLHLMFSNYLPQVFNISNICSNTFSNTKDMFFFIITMSYVFDN